MYFSKDTDSIPTFESPWIHRGWTPAAFRLRSRKNREKEEMLVLTTFIQHCIKGINSVIIEKNRTKQNQQKKKIKKKNLIYRLENHK